MSNAFYGKGKDNILKGNVALLTSTIKLQLLDTGVYTVNLATHEFHSSLTGLVGSPQTLASKVLNLGLFTAAALVFPTLSGVTVEAAALYLDTGTSATSPLIAYYDTAGGFTLTPNGQDLTLNWHATDGVFRING
jgi:hypothetical protein